VVTAQDVVTIDLDHPVEIVERIVEVLQLAFRKRALIVRL